MATDPDSLSVQSQQSIRCKFTDRQRDTLFIMCFKHKRLNRQVAQLSQRDRAAGWVRNGHKWKTGTERQYLWTV